MWQKRNSIYLRQCGGLGVIFMPGERRLQSAILIALSRENVLILLVG